MSHEYQGPIDIECHSYGLELGSVHGKYQLAKQRVAHVQNKEQQEHSKTRVQGARRHQSREDETRLSSPLM